MGIEVIVTAGGTADEPDGSYTRKWIVTEDQMHKSDSTIRLFASLVTEVNSYVASLQIAAYSGEPPRWIKTEWAWT